MKLIISLATRGRPERVIDTVKRSVVNWTHPETELQIQVDEDDQATIDALDIVKMRELLPLESQGLWINVKPREDTIAEKWNRAVKTWADVYLVAADDDPYVVPGYDSLILEAAERFPDGIGMVYGHLANMSFSGCVAPTRKFVELIGGVIFPPLFPYWFVDHWTDDLARMTGRISFANIRTDQSKPGVTQEMREPGWWATFYDAAYLFRRTQALAILNNADCVTPQWQKDLLISTFPLVDVRSRMINHNVRANNDLLVKQAGSPPVDERYLRVKNRAIAMVPDLLQNYGMPEHEQNMFSMVLLGEKLGKAA